MEEVILALLVMIRAVESTDGRDPRANGNEYQISSICVHDVNRIYKTHYVWPRDVRDRETAENIAVMYLTYYGLKWAHEYGRVPTQSDLARIYNRGYEGAKRGEGAGYARKVEAAWKRSRYNAQKREGRRAK